MRSEIINVKDKCAMVRVRVRVRVCTCTCVHARACVWVVISRIGRRWNQPRECGRLCIVPSAPIVIFQFRYLDFVYGIYIPKAEFRLCDEHIFFREKYGGERKKKGGGGKKGREKILIR